MDTSISPVMRIVTIIFLILTPLAVVILQRLEDIREINKKRKNGELDLSLEGFFPRNEKSKQPKPGEAVCPQCHAGNPADHQFCGYCGALLNPENEENK